MIKLLVSPEFGIVGACDVPRWVNGTAEYGRRDAEGILSVYGVADVEPLSGHGRSEPKLSSDCETVTVLDRQGFEQELRLYDI